MNEHALTNPHVVFLVDRRGWAYSSVVQSIVACLESSFNFHVFHLDRDQPDLQALNPDLIYVSFWGETYHQRFVFPPNRIIREVASLRWMEGEPGPFSPSAFAAYFLHDAGTLVTPSKEIRQLFEEVGIPFRHCPNGVDTEVFHFRPAPTGPMRIGWIGNPNDSCKGLHDVILPAVTDFSFKYTPGSWSRRRVSRFLGEIDVLLIASTSEGQPLPLLEAMASGVFPVTTNVGIAPELIHNKETGLIVDRSVSSFQSALNWCQDHLTEIRRRREQISKEVCTKRDWKEIATHFEQLFFEVLSAKPGGSAVRQLSLKEGYRGPIKTEACTISAKSDRRAAMGYHLHLQNVQNGPPDYADQGVKATMIEDIVRNITNDRDSRILEIGPGQGAFLNLLCELKYRRVEAVERSKELVEMLNSRLGDRVTSIHHADALDFLSGHSDSFDAIVAMDVVEHFAPERLVDFAAASHCALRFSGRLLLRTPNMANVFAAYSRFIDLTHTIGFTESSLEQLLVAGGYSRVNIIEPPHRGSRLGIFMVRAAEKIQRNLMRFQGRTVPRCLGVNLIAVADQ